MLKANFGGSQKFPTSMTGNYFINQRVLLLVYVWQSLNCHKCNVSKSKQLSMWKIIGKMQMMIMIMMMMVERMEKMIMIMMMAFFQTEREAGIHGGVACGQ